MFHSLLSSKPVSALALALERRTGQGVAVALLTYCCTALMYMIHMWAAAMVGQ